MTLADLWFVIIAILWAGYFMLDGFDFGVGILLPVLARSEVERRVLINTIGPVWDGNEVWVIVAGGATFAAFPEWYATLFSALYLALLLILVALILRGVSFEYRGKRDHPTWRRRWDACIFVGSLLPAFLWGVAFGNIERGIPLDLNHEFVGNFGTLLNGYAILAGITTLALFITHGAFFIALKTAGDIRVRANRLAGLLGAVTAVIAVAFLAWTIAMHTAAAGIVLTILAGLALLGGVAANQVRREGWAFTGTAACIVLFVGAIFAALYPYVLRSTRGGATNLTVDNASSSHTTLLIMTIVAVILTPLVVLYEAWSYWVFRKRISTADIPAAE